MQLMIYRIFIKLLDKKLFFCLPPPLPQKKVHDFISSEQCHFFGFHLRKQRKGAKKQWVWGGVKETIKGEIINYILLKCYLK